MSSLHRPLLPTPFAPTPSLRATGGPPTLPSAGACITSNVSFTPSAAQGSPDSAGAGTAMPSSSAPPAAVGSGFWMFHRSPTSPPAGDVAAMRTKAQELGYDLSLLRDVPQEGCQYPEVPT